MISASSDYPNPKTGSQVDPDENLKGDASVKIKQSDSQEDERQGIGKQVKYTAVDQGCGKNPDHPMESSRINTQSCKIEIPEPFDGQDEPKKQSEGQSYYNRSSGYSMFFRLYHHPVKLAEFVAGYKPVAGCRFHCDDR